MRQKEIAFMESTKSLLSFNSFIKLLEKCYYLKVANIIYHSFRSYFDEIKSNLRNCKYNVYYIVNQNILPTKGICKTKEAHPGGNIDTCWIPHYMEYKINVSMMEMTAYMNMIHIVTFWTNCMMLQTESCHSYYGWIFKHIYVSWHTTCCNLLFIWLGNSAK